MNEGAAAATAGRVAARRRAPRKGAAEPKSTPKAPRVSGGKPKARGKSGGQGSVFLRRALLVFAMVAIGFFAVMVFDVAAKLVGTVRLGETTVTDLWHKVVDRALDRDVPRGDVAKPASPRVAHAATPTPIARPVRAEPARAPLPAARPEEDARHAGSGPDVQEQRARQHLDDLLHRL